MMDDFDVVITTFLRFSNVLCYFLMAHMRIKKTCFVSYTLAGTDLLCMLNWGTQWTMVSYLKK